MDLFSTTKKTENLFYTGPRGGKHKYGVKETTRGSLMGLFTKGLFLFLLYLFLGGIVAWSDQVKWLLIIGVGIWLLMR
jgi:predicted lipid-binding transport protein (Tim44 family)